jgi:uncharacterized membrane protein/uncharacterized membrane protein YbhN (UPF0104 family)
MGILEIGRGSASVNLGVSVTIRFMRIPWKRLAQVAVLVLALGFLAALVRGQWAALRAYRWQLAPGWLALALLGLELTWLFELDTWRAVLRSLGGPLPYGRAAQVWFLSNIIRYIPGNVWQFLGMAEMAAENGIPRVATFSSIVLHQALSTAAGLALAAVYFAVAGQGEWFARFRPVLWLVPLGLLLLQPRILERVLNWALVKLRRPPLHITLTWGQVWVLLARYLVVWTGMGLSYAALVRALTPVPSSVVPYLVAAWAAAYVVGYLSLLTPSGLGVREGVMVLLLTAIMAEPVAAVVAIAARLWMVAGEIIGAGASLVWMRNLTPSPRLRGEPPSLRRKGEISVEQHGGEAGSPVAAQPQQPGAETDSQTGARLDGAGMAASARPQPVGDADVPGASQPQPGAEAAGLKTPSPAGATGDPQSASQPDRALFSQPVGFQPRALAADAGVPGATSQQYRADAHPQSASQPDRASSSQPGGFSPGLLAVDASVGETFHPFSRAIRALRPSYLLIFLMLAFTVWFSVYSIRLYDAHIMHKADLGQMDLALWNTAHGRFVQEIKGAAISTRLTDHVEPIFAPLSLALRIWDDVRALLILQAATLAAGAWPIFLLARRRLDRAGVGQWAGWGGLIFGAVYLLTPALQAAAVADFHAVPFAAALIAWALWEIERRRWGWFALAALLVMSVQEGMALLAAALGVYAAARAVFGRGELNDSDEHGIGSETVAIRRSSFWRRAVAPGALVGVAVALAGVVWFYVTTFVIIPHFAAQAYGVGATPYAARFGALGDSFGGVLKSFVTQPGLVWGILTEPLRLRYLFGLFAPSAFLALLAPEVLALSLPLLLANLLSGYPFQYSGELHYSAPLVPYFIVAGAIGLSRLVGWARRWQAARNTEASATRPVTSRLAASLLGLILLAACGYQAWAGYTPLAREFWRRLPGGWPAVTAHDRLLDRFVTQIPAGAAVSTAADLYPHLSHRERLYQFPEVGDADWALVDVSGVTDRHPADIRAAIEKLLAGGWGVADAADGYALLQRGGGQAALPDAFYDFARAQGDETGHPQYNVDITFGGALKLVGYDVLDDPKWRRTGLRFYWQALAPLPEGTLISVGLLTPDGKLAEDFVQRPMPALLWYPPERWRPGETTVIESAAWYLPKTWAPVIQVTAGQSVMEASLTGTPAGAEIIPDGDARLAAWTREGGRLALLADPIDTPTVSPADTAANVAYHGADWGVRLAGSRVPAAAAPGSVLPVMLHWEALAPGPAPRDYTVFLHLRDAAGRTVANGDGQPVWFTSRPTSAWMGAGGAPYATWDAHTLALPGDLAAGEYTLAAGWYHQPTGERLPVTEPSGNTANTEYVLGKVRVDPRSAPQPDLACLLAAESCASQDTK